MTARHEITTASGRSRRRAPGARGFTLVEVLVSMALVLIVLPVAMRGFSLATALADDARHRTEALMHTEAELARLVVTGDWERAAGHGDFGPEAPDLAWRLERRDRSESEDLTELALTTSWSTRGRQHEITLTTLVAVSRP